MHIQNRTGPDGPASDDSGRRDDAEPEYELIALRSHRRVPPDRPVTDSGPPEETQGGHGSSTATAA